jgi:hypothetical protein
VEQAAQRNVVRFEIENEGSTSLASTDSGSMNHGYEPILCGVWPHAKTKLDLILNPQAEGFRKDSGCGKPSGIGTLGFSHLRQSAYPEARTGVFPPILTTAPVCARQDSNLQPSGYEPSD